MSDWGETIKAVLLVWVIAFVICYICWGIQPWLRHRYKQLIRRHERVRFSSDVNTDMIGYHIRKNRWNELTWTCAWLGLWYWQPTVQLCVFGSFVYMMLLLRKFFKNTAFQTQQSVMLTDKHLWLFPERLGHPFWKGEPRYSLLWTGEEGYRVDGSYVQVYRGEEVVIQFEFAPYDYEAVRSVLSELRVKRLDSSDRIWVALLDEKSLHLLEDELCEMGWNLLDLFHEELQQLKVRPEFGVMRNMPGDRLLEEHARSWLQLNLLDVQTGESQASSSFPLWQSTGSVGFLIGARGQEAVDLLQQWIRDVLVESTQRAEEVVS
jgi:hypothetical protein